MTYNYSAKPDLRSMVNFIVKNDYLGPGVHRFSLIPGVLETWRTAFFKHLSKTVGGYGKVVFLQHGELSMPSSVIQLEVIHSLNGSMKHILLRHFSKVLKNTCSD